MVAEYDAAARIQHLWRRGAAAAKRHELHEARRGRLAEAQKLADLAEAAILIQTRFRILRARARVAIVRRQAAVAKAEAEGYSAAAATIAGQAPPGAPARSKGQGGVEFETSTPAGRLAAAMARDKDVARFAPYRYVHPALLDDELFDAVACGAGVAAARDGVRAEAVHALFDAIDIERSGRVPRTQTAAAVGRVTADLTADDPIDVLDRCVDPARMMLTLDEFTVAMFRAAAL